MASSTPSRTDTVTTSPSVSAHQGSTETLDHTYYDQPVVRTSQEIAQNPTDSNRPKVWGFYLQTCCKCIALLLAFEGIIVIGSGIGLLVYQARERKRDSRGEPSTPNYLQAWVFAGAFFTCRGVLYLFSSVFLGVSVSKPYLSGNRCWLLSHGTFVACSWIVTAIGIVIYAPTSRIRLEFAAPMVLTLIDFYGMYIVWLLTKEIEAAEYIQMRFDLMHRNSNNRGYMPYGLEITSSKSYHVIMDQDLTNQDEKKPPLVGSSSYINAGRPVEPGGFDRETSETIEPVKLDKKDNKGPLKPMGESQQGSGPPGQAGKQGPINKGQQKDPNAKPESSAPRGSGSGPPGSKGQAPASRPAGEPQQVPLGSGPKGNDNQNNKGPNSSPAANSRSASPAEPHRGSGSGPTSSNKPAPANEKVGSSDEEDAAAKAARDRRRHKTPKTKSLRRSFE